MKLKLTFHPPASLLPPAEELADAGRFGIEALLRRHLRERHDSRPPRGAMPRSSYWDEAASSVRSSVSGNSALIWIDQVGVALHFYGGIVLPTNGRKSLAIPKHPAVHDEKPSAFDPSRQILSLVWPKGKKAGTLRHKQSGAVYYLLVPRAKIRPDETVLPTEEKMLDAASKAMESIK